MNHAENREARAAGRADARNGEGKLGAAQRPGARTTGVLDPGPPRRPRLKQAIELIPASDGKLYLLRGEAIGDFKIDDEPHARTLLTALDGTRSPADVAALVAESHQDVTSAGVLDALGQLVSLGLVEDAAADEALPAAERARYERQLRYFGDLVAPGHSRVEPHKRLRNARVVVLGVGGLGSWAAYALACAGVGQLDLVDGDVVEMSNLNRQILFGEADLGRPKAEVAAAQLQRFNAGLAARGIVRRLESADQVRRVAAGADFVIDAADWPAHEIERWVTTACFDLSIPFITMSHMPPLGRIGPMFVPGETGCYFCIEEDCRARHPLFDELSAGQGMNSSPAPTFGPMCGVIGGQVATDTVHHLTGLAEPSSYGRALIVDLRTMETTREEVPARPECPVCHGGGGSSTSGPVRPRSA